VKGRTSFREKRKPELRQDFMRSRPDSTHAWIGAKALAKEPNGKLKTTCERIEGKSKPVSDQLEDPNQNGKNNIPHEIQN
jgi:hypothetical protein